WSENLPWHIPSAQDRVNCYHSGQNLLALQSTYHIEASISNPAFCTLSKMGGLTDLLMWLHKRIEEKGGEVGKVHPLAQSFLVSISSRMLVWLSRPVHLLGCGLDLNLALS